MEKIFRKSQVCISVASVYMCHTNKSIIKYEFLILDGIHLHVSVNIQFKYSIP